MTRIVSGYICRRCSQLVHMRMNGFVLCRHNPPGVPAGGARKVAAGGGAEGGRELDLRRAIGSARAHRAEELAVDKKACKVGGLTVEPRGPGAWALPLRQGGRGHSSARLHLADRERGVQESCKGVTSRCEAEVISTLQ